MTLDQPLLRVSRTKAACTRCRAAKTKCDGKLPACTACERTGRGAECANSNDQFAQGTERSYVATLESRVEKLEKRLAKARGSKQGAEPRRPSLQLLTRSDTLPSSSTTLSPGQTLEQNTVDSLVSDFGLLAVNATARDYYGFTTSVSYARLITAAALRNPLPSGPKPALPERRDALFLVEHYLSNRFVVLPVFDETAFWTSLDTMYANPRLASPMDVWNLRLVIAISLLSLSEQPGDLKYNEAVSHLRAAVEVADEVLHPGSISSIQAMLLLIEYSRMDAHHFDVWTLVGAASRNLVDLGLHQDPHRGTAMPRAKLETRRRVFHCLYALDRSTSMACGRTFSFSDASVSVALPRISGSLQTSTNVSRGWLQSYDCALDLFRLRQIQSRFYQDIFQSSRALWTTPYPYVWQCWHKLDAWHRALSTKIPDNFRSLLHLDLLWSYVYLLAPNIKVPETSPLAQSLLFEYSIQAVELMASGLQKSTVRPWFTIGNAVGLYTIGHHFLDCVSKNKTWILSGAIPVEANIQIETIESTGRDAGPSDQNTRITPNPPIFPYPARQNNKERALQCITRTEDTLGALGIRFGFMKWRDRFQQKSAGVVAELLAWQKPDAASGVASASTRTAPAPHRQLQQPYFDHEYPPQQPQPPTLDLRGLLPPYASNTTDGDVRFAGPDAGGESDVGNVGGGFDWNNLGTGF